MDGVNAVRVGLLREDEVVLVPGNGLPVRLVHRVAFDLVAEVLVKVGLTDVAGRDIVAQRAVGQRLSVRVNKEVVVDGASNVVPWVDTLESSNTVSISLLDAAEESCIDVGQIRRVAIALGDYTRVYTRGVAVPELEVNAGNRLAGVDVDDLVVQDDRNSTLAIGDIGADELTANI